MVDASPLGPVDSMVDASPLGPVDSMVDASPLGPVDSMVDASPLGPVDSMVDASPLGSGCHDMNDRLSETKNCQNSTRATTAAEETVRTVDHKEAINTDHSIGCLTEQGNKTLESEPSSAFPQVTAQMESNSVWPLKSMSNLEIKCNSAALSPRSYEASSFNAMFVGASDTSCTTLTSQTSHVPDTSHIHSVHFPDRHQKTCDTVDTIGTSLGQCRSTLTQCKTKELPSDMILNDQMPSPELTPLVTSSFSTCQHPVNSLSFNSMVGKPAPMSRLTRSHHLASEVTKVSGPSISSHQQLEFVDRYSDPNEPACHDAKQETESRDSYRWMGSPFSNLEQIQKSTAAAFPNSTRLEEVSFEASLVKDDPLSSTGFAQSFERQFTGRGSLEMSRLRCGQTSGQAGSWVSSGGGQLDRHDLAFDRSSPTLSEPCHTVFRYPEDSETAAAQSLARQRRYGVYDVHSQPRHGYQSLGTNNSQCVDSDVVDVSSNFRSDIVSPSFSPLAGWDLLGNSHSQTDTQDIHTQQELSGADEDLLQFVLRLTDTPPTDRSPSGSQLCEGVRKASQSQQPHESGTGRSLADPNLNIPDSSSNEQQTGHLSCKVNEIYSFNSARSSTCRPGISVSGYSNIPAELPRGRSLQQFVSLPYSCIDETHITKSESTLVADGMCASSVGGTCKSTADGTCKSTADGTCKSVNSLLSALSFGGSLTNVSTPSRFPGTPTWTTTPPDIATPTALSRRTSMNGIFQRLDSSVAEQAGTRSEIGNGSGNGSGNELPKLHVRRRSSSKVIGESLLEGSELEKVLQDEHAANQFREDCLSCESSRQSHHKPALSPLTEASGSSFSCCGVQAETTLQETPISLLAESPPQRSIPADPSWYQDHSHQADNFAKNTFDVGIENQSHRSTQPIESHDGGGLMDIPIFECDLLENQSQPSRQILLQRDEDERSHRETAHDYLSLISPPSDVIPEASDTLPDGLSCIPSPPYHRHLSFDSSYNVDSSHPPLEATFQLFASPPQQLFDPMYNRHIAYEAMSEPAQTRSRLGSSLLLDDCPNSFTNNETVNFEMSEPARRKASFDSEQHSAQIGYSPSDQLWQFSPTFPTHWPLHPFSSLVPATESEGYTEEIGGNGQQEIRRTSQSSQHAALRHQHRLLPPPKLSLDFYPLSSAGCGNTPKRWQNLNVVFPLFVPHGTVAILRPNGENTYVFSDSHPSSQLLFSAAGKVCDTWATYLRLRVAVIHKCPEFLVPRVAQLFNQILAGIPKFSSPITLNCTGMVKHTIQLRSSGSVTYRYDTIGNLATPEDQEKMRTLFEGLKKVKADVNHYLAKELDSGVRAAKELRSLQMGGSEVESIGGAASTMNNLLSRSSKSGLEFRFSPCRELKIAIREGTLCECDGIDSMIAGGGASSMSTWASQFVVENLVIGEIRLERDKTTEIQFDPFYLPNHNVKTRFITRDLRGQSARVCFVDRSIYPELYRPPVEYCIGLTPLQAARALCGSTHQILAEALPNGFRSLVGKACPDALLSMSHNSRIPLSGRTDSGRNGQQSPHKDRQGGFAVETSSTQTTTASDDKDAAPWANFWVDPSSAVPHSHSRTRCNLPSVDLYDQQKLIDSERHDDQDMPDPRECNRTETQDIDTATRPWQTSPGPLEVASPSCWKRRAPPATQQCSGSNVSVTHDYMSNSATAENHVMNGRSAAEWPALDGNLEIQGVPSPGTSSTAIIQQEAPQQALSYCAFSLPNRPHPSKENEFKALAKTLGKGSRSLQRQKSVG